MCNKHEKKGPDDQLRKMFRNNQDHSSRSAEYYGRYLLKKASNAVQLNSASCCDVSNSEESKHARSGRTCGVSHSILYNGDKWDTVNDEETMEDISMLNQVSIQPVQRPVNRLCNSPDPFRLNRSADIVTPSYSTNYGNFLRPFEYAVQSSSDSRIQQGSQSPRLKHFETHDAIATNQETINQQEVTPERGSNILRLNSCVDVESCFSELNEMKCRYCFGGALGWIVKEPLISPCWCSGSLAYVHRSCLEQWLTTRKQSSCDLCKYEFITTKKYKPITEIQFQRMEGEDVFLIIVTILVYVTFIFQFLAAAYIGLIAEHIPASVLAVSMTGLGLGLFWFLIGCIALTVVTYTSEYWVTWRKTNKRISIVMSSINNLNKKQSTEEESDEMNTLASTQS